jgi:hypothetical protein
LTGDRVNDFCAQEGIQPPNEPADATVNLGASGKPAPNLLNSREGLERFVEDILDKNPKLSADKIAERIAEITGKSSASAVKRLSAWKANQDRLRSQKRQREIRVRPTTPAMMGGILDGKAHAAWKSEQRAEREEPESACDQIVVTDRDLERYFRANPHRKADFLDMDRIEQDQHVAVWLLDPNLGD